MRRPKVPRFAVPVLVSLPLWAFVYAGTMTTATGPADPVLALGESVYASNCASCHGAGGEGGSGRPLDEVLSVFPDRADHVAWIEGGNEDVPKGQPYGEGRIAGSDGFTTVMPGFRDTLSPEEIAAVVRYEREEFGGEEAPAPGDVAEGADAEGGGEGTGTEGGTSSPTGEAETEGGNVGGRDQDAE